MTQVASRRNVSSSISWTAMYGALRRGLIPLCLITAYLLLRFHSLDLVGVDHRETTITLENQISYPTSNNAADVKYVPERAIFIISMGAQAANSSLVERFVYSARTLGDYSGWIVVLTDAPEGRYDTLQGYPFPNKELNEDSRLVFVRPDAKYYPNTSFKNKDMIFKRMKTYILDILDDDTRFDNVQLVYYLDVDNIFANTADGMFQELESSYGIGDDSNTHPRIHFFEGDQRKGRNGPRMKFQGGQFILERRSSKKCLEKWRHWIDSDPNEPLDQIALLKMFEDSKKYTNACELVAMSKTGSTHDRIAFPSKKDMEWAANYQRMVQSGRAKEATGREQFPTLIHVKNTGNALQKTNDDDMELYLRTVLNLTDSFNDILGITKKIGRIQALETDMETDTTQS